MVRRAAADTWIMAATVETLDPALEEQLTRARERVRRDLTGREAVVRVVFTCNFLVSALVLALLGHVQEHPDWWRYAAFVGAYALVSSIRIEVGSGLALPTEIVLVPMLFELPAAHVPFVVGAGLVAAALPDVARGTMSPARAAVLPASALFIFGPALVFLAAHEPRADWHGGLVLVLALLAQFAFDFAASWALERLALGVRLVELVRPFAWTLAFDALVAPLAYGIAVADRVQEGAALLPLPLLGLLALFARERRERYDSILELSAAYRGTTFLLGDVVEADDAYTGNHSREVVELVLGVCDRMGLGPSERRVAEFTALLHDVGKIRIPSEVINKPGPLTAEERTLINTHTIEGEQLLLRVGGLLADVGRLVRHCHERWDGAGYPDGLAGEETPLIARIVGCCDAYNAMTTDRPYRRALTREAAVAELLANRGTQFDPDVVDAVLALVRAGRYLLQ
jgi:HD-GYP domain-containing protein (c-di-GMP phosphodiesterase class II)